MILFGFTRFLFDLTGFFYSIFDVTGFLKHHGFEFAHIDNSAYVSKKELRCHYEWPKFISGEPKSLKQIKDFHSYLGSNAVVRGRGQETFGGWIKRLHL